MNTLPALLDSSHTHYDLFDLEETRDELKNILETFYDKKEMLQPIVIAPNHVKFTEVQVLIAKYQDLKADAKAKTDVGKAVLDRLKETNSDTDGFIKNALKCKKLYKKINHLVHPDKLGPESDKELCASFQTLATQYYEARDYDALLALYTDVCSHWAGVQVEVDTADVTSSSLSRRILKVKQEIRALKDEHHLMSQDEFSRVVHIYDMHGKQMAIVFYSKILDAQIEHFSNLIRRLEFEMSGNSNPYRSFNF